MNGITIAFTLISVISLLLLPRRWAPMPLLAGACYVTVGQGIEIGPFSFTVIRILVLVGAVRVIARGEHLAGRLNGIDRLMLVWAAWVLLSSAFHNDPSSALVFRLGLVYSACGIYFLLRALCRSLDDIVGLSRITAVLLLPVALEMLYEVLTQNNLFFALGGIERGLAVRDGRIRAVGPFQHSILAGTVGAVCLPFLIALWAKYRKEAIAGIVVCLTMIFAAKSSGPILTGMAAIGALYMWRYRDRMRLIRWVVLLGYIVLDLVMKAPAYFLIARIDLAGGSKGWHRSRLIQSAFEHLSEWWLAGTDYTRHWMPSGVSWSSDHTDITNHYLHMGVVGGLPLMLLFIAIMVKGFSLVGQMLKQTPEQQPRQSRFLVWTLGASLFAHAVTFISVSYFDQSSLFIYLTLAMIGSAWTATCGARSVAPMLIFQNKNSLARRTIPGN
jgi:hypothetical protein